MTTIFFILGIVLIVLTVAAKFIMKNFSRGNTVAGILIGSLFLITSGIIVTSGTGRPVPYEP